MSRKSWAIVMIVLVLIAACTPQTGNKETSTGPTDVPVTDSEVCSPDGGCGDETAAEETATITAEPTAEPAVPPTVEPTAKPTAEPTQAQQETVAETAVPVEDLLEVQETDWTMGPEDALFTLIEYSDYLCPHCSAVAAPVMNILAEFPEDIRFVYRHFPLTSDPESPNHLAVRAAEAAGIQGSFFDFHNLLFEKQSEWKVLGTLDEIRDQFIEYAGSLGLDKEKFTQDMDSPEMEAKAVAAYQQALAIGLQGTPTFFLNGSNLNAGAFSAPIEQWKTFIEGQKAILTLPVYERPPMTIDPEKEYLATVKMEKGDIVIQLLPKSAPATVNSFIFLAKKGWYDGITFHRVLADFMAQTGDPSGTGMGGPGYTFENEIDPELTFDGPGMVAMANAGADTNGSQWFITFAAAPHLDGNYTIFGRVIEGMDVVNSITLRDPSANPDFEGDKIISVTIEEK